MFFCLYEQLAAVILFENLYSATIKAEYEGAIYSKCTIMHPPPPCYPIFPLPRVCEWSYLYLLEPL